MHVAASVHVAVGMFMAVSLCLRMCEAAVWDCVCVHVAVSSACVCVGWMEAGNRLDLLLGTRGARVEEELSRRRWKLRVEA